MSNEEEDNHARKTREEKKPEGLLGESFGEKAVPEWKEHWWAMPSFRMGNAQPNRQIMVNFFTDDDVKEFAKKLDLSIYKKTRSVWFPRVTRTRSKDWIFEGGDHSGRFPIYIPSKGRWDRQKTSQALQRMGVPHNVVVEAQEAARYREQLQPLATLLVMPFGNLGQGSIPARNFIWEQAVKAGVSHHWIIDDNVLDFYRLTVNRRIRVGTGAIFRAAEDWVLRYTNVAMAGLGDITFFPERDPKIPPFRLNTRIYSMSLIRTDLPFRWRGRYNEDTDLSLRVLKAGWVTIQFSAFLGDKLSTKSAVNKGTPGGNTDTVYKADDFRLAFAKSLQEQHPDVVKIVWKYSRWHHEVDYRPFKKNKPILREGVTPMGPDFINDYGMRLRAKRRTHLKPKEEQDS